MESRIIITGWSASRWCSASSTTPATRPGYSPPLDMAPRPNTTLPTEAFWAHGASEPPASRFTKAAYGRLLTRLKEDSSKRASSGASSSSSCCAATFCVGRSSADSGADSVAVASSTGLSSKHHICHACLLGFAMCSGTHRTSSADSSVVLHHEQHARFHLASLAAYPGVFSAVGQLITKHSKSDTGVDKVPSSSVWAAQRAARIAQDGDT
ncbi:hypothetical protein BCR43DRAFT_515820 [Syncephalastrum racemosum]|uniref:Uncharacterized protein n=1 Tax=Syncephalastrum racemosum TaxID=13706 RepID=A0A1X2HAM3_SYNRA|nr:hypothetical protein BCR43DRAFT_515820 [Syncephalastrum racemosum]